MARHRREPDTRHQWRTGDEPSPGPGSRDGRFGTAFRRVIVTPTFAAGLGVVIAAGLAYPMSRTVFRYIAPGTHAQACAAYGCGGPSGTPGQPALAAPSHRPPAGPGVPAAAAPVKPLPTARSQRHGHHGARAGRDQSGPAMSYRTVQQSRQGFVGVMMIVLRGQRAPAHWWLRFSYPRGEMQSVHVDGPGVRASVRNSHTAEVLAVGPGAHRQLVSMTVSFAVAGASAGLPGVCLFDGATCRPVDLTP